MMVLLLFSAYRAALPQEEKTPVIVGFPENYFNDLDIRDARAAIEVWGNNLTLLKPTRFYLQTILFSDLQNLEEIYRHDKIDLLFLPVLDYLKIKNKIAIEPVVCGGWDQEYGDSFLLVVNKASGITNLAELQNKELIISADGSDELMNYWLEVQLRKNNLPAMTSFFNKTTHVNKGNQALLPVFFNQKTACLIKRNIYTTLNKLNPQIQEKLFIIIESPLYIRDVFCINSAITSKNRDLISDIIMTIDKDAAGKQILLLFKRQTILPYKPEYIYNVETLLQDYKKLQLPPR